MTDQTMILILVILGTAVTLYLYFWKAKKQIDYKGDERWQLVQNKANNAANAANYILILVVAIGETILLYSDTEITVSLSRVFLFAILFIALRNGIEMAALQHYDRKL